MPRKRWYNHLQECISRWLEMWNKIRIPSICWGGFPISRNILAQLWTCRISHRTFSLWCCLDPKWIVTTTSLFEHHEMPPLVNHSEQWGVMVLDKVCCGVVHFSCQAIIEFICRGLWLKCEQMKSLQYPKCCSCLWVVDCGRIPPMSENLDDAGLHMTASAKLRLMSWIPWSSKTVKSSLNASTARIHGKPSRWPSWTLSPSDLSVTLSKKVPFQCYKKLLVIEYHTIIQVKNLPENGAEGCIHGLPECILHMLIDLHSSHCIDILEVGYNINNSMPR